MSALSPTPQPTAAAGGLGAAPEPAPEAEALHHDIARLLDALPEPSLRLLAAMAVVDQETPLPILAVIADLADPSAALDDLIEAGFVTWVPRGLAQPVGISSPSLRGAVYWNLPASLRRAMHLASAEQVSGVHGLQHALLGAGRSDPELAARLEDEATRYHQAGDTERAGTLLLWSADVSVDRDEQERRLLIAALWGLQTQTAGWAAALGQRLALLEPSVERNLFLGHLAGREARFEAAQSLLDQARRLVEDRSVAERAAVELAAATLHADAGDHAAEQRVALSLLAQDGLPEEAREWAVWFAADAHGRIHRSADASLHRLESLAPELGASDAERPGHGVLRWARGMWLLQSGRPGQAMSDLQWVLRSHDGPVGPILPLSYALLGFAQFQLGDWEAALRDAQEGVRVAEARNDRRYAVPAAALTASISALRGDWEVASELVDSLARDQRILGPARYAVFPAVAAATLAQVRGEPGRVLAALAPVTAQPGLFSTEQMLWRPLYVEALIDTGRLATARTALAPLRAAVEHGARPTAVTARLEAGLAAAEGDLAAATDRLAAAVEQPVAEDSPFGLAQLEHDYGRLLLGARRRRSAIKWLLSAHGRYVRLGARPFAERCLGQLRETGAHIPGAGTGGVEGGAETAGRRPVSLTQQEHRIAQLAAQGLTNQQIARALFVSAKTIEYHLGNVFAKLGIGSRRQLRAELAALTDDGIEKGHEAGQHADRAAGPTARPRY
ncbi:LuxR C-terminal-related transcriptional regulator [Streptomyces sp. NPDC059629]|uniref:LuxR C-terminal-related transcriptional regulator n=1 Tax=Streptomyces sp. NPDC059629 TaxID=3346889 RepID=UPI0036871574